MGRLGGRIESYVIVLTPRIRGPGQLIVRTEGLVPVQAQRGHVEADSRVAGGVRVEVGEDSLTIHGCGGPPRGGAVIAARHDHRIAMSFLVLGGAAQRPVTVEGAETIETSFPGFAALINRLGGRIEMLEP